MPLPIVNSRLLEIRGGGTTPSYRAAAGPDLVKWKGNVGSFCEEKVIRSTAQGSLDRFKQTSLVIPGDLRPPVEIKTGDTVKYRYQKKDFEREVQSLEGWFGVGPKIIELFFADE